MNNWSTSDFVHSYHAETDSDLYLYTYYYLVMHNLPEEQIQRPLGAIVGIVVGAMVIVLIVLLVVLIVMFFCWMQ